MELSMEQIKAEAKRMSGLTLEEYLKASRKGADFALNRKERKELFLAVETMKHDPDWERYLRPGGGSLEHLNGIEDRIHERDEAWFGPSL